jgi:hypothetical protein
MMEESKTKNPTKTFPGKEKSLLDTDTVEINVYLQSDLIKGFIIEVG